MAPKMALTTIIFYKKTIFLEVPETLPAMAAQLDSSSLATDTCIRFVCGPPRADGGSSSEGPRALFSPRALCAGFLGGGALNSPGSSVPALGKSHGTAIALPPAPLPLSPD